MFLRSSFHGARRFWIRIRLPVVMQIGEGADSCWYFNTCACWSLHERRERIQEVIDIRPDVILV